MLVDEPKYGSTAGVEAPPTRPNVVELPADVEQSPSVVEIAHGETAATE
jgi:hypothetical protein